MASVTDKFRKAAPAFSTTLQSDKSAGAASCTLQSATGVPGDTGIDITVGRVDANGAKTPALKAVYKGTLSSTTVSNLTLVEGTDQLHRAGTPVEITYTATNHNDIIGGILTQHNQDGTHGSITTTGYSQSTGSFTAPNSVIQPPVLSTSELGYIEITSSVTVNSATPAQVAGLTLTVTPPAGNRKVEVIVDCSTLSNGTVNGQSVMSLWQGVVGSGTCLKKAKAANNGNTGVAGAPGATIVYRGNPGAGAITYNVGLAFVNGSNATINAAGDEPASLSAKLI